MDKILKAFSGSYDIWNFSGFLGSILVWDLVKIAVLLAFGLFVISIVMEMYKYVLDQGGNYNNIITRIIIVAILLSFYGPIIKSTYKFVDTFADHYGLTSSLEKMLKDTNKVNDENKTLSEKQKGSIKGGENAKPEKKPWWPDFSKILPDLSPVNIITQLLIFLAQVVVIIVNAIRNLMLTVLIAIGPVAIATYASPSFQMYGSGWTKSYLNVLSWPIWMTILIRLQNALITKAMESDGYNQFVIVAYNIVLIYMLLKVMTFLPEILSGKAGATNPLAAVILAAAGGLAYKTMKAGWNHRDTIGDVAKTGAQMTSGLMHGVNTGDFNPLHNVLANRVPTKAMSERVKQTAHSLTPQGMMNDE